MRMKALIVVLVATYGCGAAQKNKVPVDTEILPYIAPDVDELSGTEPADEETGDDTEKPAPAQNPQK